MIAIVDYGAGNMHSIAHALEHVGAHVQVTDDPARWSMLKLSCCPVWARRVRPWRR